MTIMSLLAMPISAQASDTTPPQRVGATTDGETVTLFFDETLDPTSVPSPEGFTVMRWFNASDTDRPAGFTHAAFYCLAGNTTVGCPLPLRSVEVIGKTVVLTLPNRARLWDDPRSLQSQYAATFTANPIQDLSGNAAESLINSGPSILVQNEAPPPPTLSDVRGGGGMWGDGATLWILDNANDDRVHAYDLATGEDDDTQDIDLPNQVTTRSGLVGDGTTIWAPDYVNWLHDAQDDPTHLFAYSMANGQRDASKDIPLAAENSHPYGVAVGAGGTLWVGDFLDLKLYAYNFATHARLQDKDVDLVAENNKPIGMWTNGTTAWVVDFDDKYIYAYDIATNARHPANDIVLYRINERPLAAWSDGTTLWVADDADGIAYEYVLPAAPPPVVDDGGSAGDETGGNDDNDGGSTTKSTGGTDDNDGGGTTKSTGGTDDNDGGGTTKSTGGTDETDGGGTTKSTGGTDDNDGGSTTKSTGGGTDGGTDSSTTKSTSGGTGGTGSGTDSSGTGGGSGGSRSSGTGSSGTDSSGTGGTSGDSRSSGSGGGDGAEGPEAPTGFLENPGPDSFQSGIGVISGWVCEAEEVVIEINGEPQVAGYGTERADTELLDGEPLCGDTDNGFGLLFNWNLLRDGAHTVVAYVDEVELGRATVTVTTLDAEDAFVEGLTGECTVEDFPLTGETVTLEWQESLQNFVITALE